MESEPRDSGPAADEPAGHRDSGDTSRSEVSDSLRHHIDELVAGIQIYIQSQIDLVKLTIRRGVVLTAIFIVTVLGAASVFVTAVVLLCMGISDVISELTGHRWIGEIGTGVLVVGGGALAAAITVKIRDRRAHRRTLEKYETLNRQENGNGKHDE
jgi:hypothetical protein